MQSTQMTENKRTPLPVTPYLRNRPAAVILLLYKFILITCISVSMNRVWVKVYIINLRGCGEISPKKAKCTIWVYSDQYSGNRDWFHSSITHHHDFLEARLERSFDLLLLSQICHVHLLLNSKTTGLPWSPVDTNYIYRLSLSSRRRLCTSVSNLTANIRTSTACEPNRGSLPQVVKCSWVLTCSWHQQHPCSVCSGLFRWGGQNLSALSRFDAFSQIELKRGHNYCSIDWFRDHPMVVAF